MLKLTVALFGHPNCGKTTLFNGLTGLRQRIGHWPGVTVECHQGQFKTARYQITLLDLPGTYSLSKYHRPVSLDEQVACDYLCSNQADLLINVIDATDLARHLYLTVQLLEQGRPCLIVLNRFDQAAKQKLLIDHYWLAEQLGVPVIPIVAMRAEGLQLICQAIDAYRPSATPLLISYPPVIEQQITRIVQQCLPTDSSERVRWLVLQGLEGEQEHSSDHLSAALQQSKSVIQQEQGEEAALLIADARYQKISMLCHSNDCVQNERINQRLDQVFLNRWLAIPLFLLVMYGVFFLSIQLGSALQPLFEGVATTLFIQGAACLGQHFGWPMGLTLCLSQGIGGGIRTLMPLIPPVGLLFLGLGLLEETGYMARAAFVMDRLMCRVGLSGKAFLPLIIGLGCNVPAVLASRILQGERERLLTILLTPFMACGARLVIFVVFSAALFGKYGVWPLFSLYLLGIIVALITGWVLRHTVVQQITVPFVMELPHYQWPSWQVLATQLWYRLAGFVLGAGKMIILTSALINGSQWFTLAGSMSEPGAISALAWVGKRLTPLFKPLGIERENWPATVGLLTGAIAKEMLLGTLDALYTNEQVYQPINLHEWTPLSDCKVAWQQTAQRLLTLFIKPWNGEAENHLESRQPLLAKKFGTSVAAYSYLIFVLLYVPCIATLGAIKREIGSLWMWFSLGWGINMAYSLSILYYQTFTFNQSPRFSSQCIMCVIAWNTLLFLGLSHFSNLIAHPTRKHSLTENTGN